MAKTVGLSELENGPIEDFAVAIQCDPSGQRIRRPMVGCLSRSGTSAALLNELSGRGSFDKLAAFSYAPSKDTLVW